MARFTFKVGGRTATGTTEEVKGVSGSRFKATGQCPYCSTLYNVGANPGNNKTERQAIAAIEFTVNRHYRDKHK